MGQAHQRLTWRSTRVAGIDDEREGRLLFIDQRLAAILVTQPLGEGASWTVAAVFGLPLDRGETFPSLDAVERRVQPGAA